MNRTISILSLLILSAIYMIGHKIYFNPTKSEIKGYYWVYKPSVYKTNDLVLVCIKDSMSIKILHQFGLPYIKNKHCKLPFLLKKIVAKEGDVVMVTTAGIQINNYLYPDTLPIKYYKNISLNPIAIGTNYQLGKDNYFLLGQGANSYDSRYFGVVNKNDLQYKAILFWQRNKPIW